MIRPVHFGFNPETAVNNAFQMPGGGKGVQEQALREFDGCVSVLRAHGVDVIVIEDNPEPHTPDSIFPNNWVSFHRNGTVCLYPMFAENRRLERRPGILESLAGKFTIKRTLDLSHYEREGLFLEGTGSMVLDRQKHIAYACLSPRTERKVLLDFCERMGYKPVPFRAVDAKGQPIYHTNVMMCVADAYVVICLDSLPINEERDQVRAAIAESEKDVVAISLDQMQHFAGNMLQVQNDKKEKLLVMSTQAYTSLTPAQREKLSSYNRIIHFPLDSIERHGGGSARCMMAEVHLPSPAQA
ncbi:MAG: arginine deiminase-related protein [Bacteroidota bacterium]|nr:arginine deiminase-related protein [Bacteroidota bacterium]MDP4217399.1 arginine deiminase-related protein [Bacteroidota bacterium]MDP4245851.1 arginine deiminase-related protein [Bacteroidota bacterium]MDP4255252.1 arginine deiminase-related protein [Bacteroidota bacterium]MDP4257397.1 arginine deiminase-related protein [Bacteroidota bacterium]